MVSITDPRIAKPNSNRHFYTLLRTIEQRSEAGARELAVGIVLQPEVVTGHSATLCKWSTIYPATIYSEDGLIAMGIGRRLTVT